MEGDPDMDRFPNGTENNNVRWRNDGRGHPMHQQWRNRPPQNQPQPQNRPPPQYRPQQQNRSRPQKRPQPQNRPQLQNRPRPQDQPQLQNRPQPHYRAQLENNMRWRNQAREQTDLMVNVHANRGHRQPNRGMDAEDNDDRLIRRDRNMNHDHKVRGQPYRNNRLIGFKALQEIAESDPLEILGKINERKEPFLNLITNAVEADMHILIIQILSKISLSSFDEIKRSLLLDVCNSQYLIYLKNYLMDLPYTEEKHRNRFYWNNENDFWKNLINFCESFFNMAPSVAMQKFRTLLEGSSKLCLEELNKRHNFVLSKENETRLTDLRERLTIFEKRNEVEKQHSKFGIAEDQEESEPPEDFRQLSVIPNRDELLEQRPFLRGNVVSGGYRDVDHYLDVQFRLLREDCFGPLREGILQFLSDPKKKRYDNMRVYRNVKFCGPYVSNTKTGMLIQLDENAMKRLKRINWAHSKKFIFGSLLLFSKDDNCNNFIIATILDRDEKYLNKGMIPVTIVENENLLTVENIIEQNDSYVMFESEVYFEPYLHVLKALKDPSFGTHIAMAQYIVNVDPTPRPPQYLHPDAIFEVETLQSPDVKFRVLDQDTWPSHEELNLDESQYEAFQLALKHEFAVIQGPPGTGKTYLGVKVAQTLIENLSNKNNKQCLMLIICYTNHALDQFLEHILKITSSIVRIGGQSKNEAMENISLNSLRRAPSKKNYSAMNLFHTEKRNLQIVMGQLRAAQKQIESLSSGILTFDSMCAFVPEATCLRYAAAWLGGGEDKLLRWLLDNVDYEVDNSSIDALLAELDDADAQQYPIDKNDDPNDRTAVIIDDLIRDIIELDINGIVVNTTFMLHEAEKKMYRLAAHYRKSKNTQEKIVLEDEIRELHYIISVFQEMRSRHRIRGVPRPVREGENVAQLPNDERWAIYFTWANTAINEIREKIAPLQQNMNKAAEMYEEARMNLDLQLLEGIQVVGMTTSGAARLRKLLKALAPPIVIVEEAAEVLEQHIVTSLTRHCKHLILIGDHQQLRPSAAYMKLVRKYDIEVSLFERMILNNMCSRRLRVQHRMRPEIAALIAPHIYHDLENHPSVEAFPRVRGFTSNLFFYTHDYKENQVDDSNSRSNQMEADMVLGLANYLMQQDYEPQDVTILAAYSGQMFYMRKQRALYAFLNEVKITVVDNYQGEESKIILLSLVRNNDENRIGFLGTENRICVALSRAKEGFYIFGNIDILKTNSELWSKIAKTLETSGSIGTSLRLRCENHQDKISIISTVKDFEKVPEGGCSLMCNFNLPACGHPCPRLCHAYDRSHSDVQCQLKCERVLCELGHVCPLICALTCRPCKVLVTKQLPCGHKMQVQCHREPSDPSVKCTTTVTVRLAACGHEAKKPCHLNVKIVACTVPCPVRVERCGHTCRRRCHVTDDPDHDRYICEKNCAKAKRGCTADLVGDRGDHQCQRQCHETCDDCNVEVMKKRSTCKHSARVACCKNVDEKPCRQNCARTLPCGHFCKKKCFEECGDCDQEVVKVIPECGHSVKVACKRPATRALCVEACALRLACGHACARRCSEPCRADLCEEPSEGALSALCGHAVRLPCHVLAAANDTSLTTRKLLEYCTAPCEATLQCGHTCAGNCGACRQGRLHLPCRQQCHVIHICGHQCTEPCNQVCPPCKKRCEVRCPHSACSKLCGAPCVPCQEKCFRRCPHSKCTRRCGEPCSRPPCDKRCRAKLPCGHACRGLCGEPCPPVCRLCRPDDFPKDFLGDDFDDDAKFILLQDCSHILEVEDADNLMNGDKETISIRACPFCRKPIINTYRYKDRVNGIYRSEINPIKERVYGTQAQVAAEQAALAAAVAVLKDTHAASIKDNEHFKTAFNRLQIFIRTQKKISLLQLKMLFLYNNIMDMIGEKIKEYKKVNGDEFSFNFLGQVKIVCEVLAANIKKISQQQQGDISNEIKRMGSILQLAKIFKHTSYLSIKTNTSVVQAAKTAQAAVLSWKIYKEDEVMAALKNLEREIKVSGIVTKAERDLIVQAIGLKQGHWYKCPNGHFYCIGECGGAMETGKCAECGVQIGGRSHTLLASNSHAPEMDDSRFAAWSQEYNNMANFRIDD